MTPRTILLIVLVTSALSIACDRARPTESVYEGPRPEPAVLTALQIWPNPATVEQGFTVQLLVTAYDQRGNAMSGVSGFSFSTSDPAIATVSSSGLVMGVVPGTVDISAAKTLQGVTRNASIKATIVKVTPLPDVVLTADANLGWQPSVAHLTAGGTARWVITAPLSWSREPHRMLYLLDAKYSVVDSLDLRNGPVTRKLETAGEYRYCSAGCWDPPDFGVVYVH